MKNLKKFQGFVNEWIDSPGSVDVPGQDSEIRVNSRNYTPARQPLPYIEDAMYEKAKIHEILDEYGNSEDFNKFLDEKKRSGREVTNKIKDIFGERK
jgi:hypothetical protein